jgi:3-phosphoshikimate 1-carboxyvinyltransferase
MLASVSSPHSLRGEIRVPGDKSVSHRALILNAVASGASVVRGLSGGDDVESTARCLRALGVEVGQGRVSGVGLRGLRRPSGPLDCGNSGTTMRLLAGLLAAQPFESELRGDESLSRRPMDRVVEPLRLMGARAADFPLRVGGQPRLRGIEYQLPVASSQVKSALLLAGLYAVGPTTVRQPAPTRDHTEVMLAAMGAEVRVEGLAVTLLPPSELRPLDVEVPGDLSAAAFWLVAGALHPDAALRIPGVGLNPTRAGALEVLREQIGVPVEERGRRRQGGEEVADLEVGTAPGPLRPFEVSGEQVPRLVDELPVLAVAATQLPGTSRVTGAAELRRKESDRISAMGAGLRAMGAEVRELEDGWEIRGPSRLRGGRVASLGDHRVAMALAVAGLLAEGPTELEGAESASISDPGFWRQLRSLC